MGGEEREQNYSKTGAKSAWLAPSRHYAYRPTWQICYFYSPNMQIKAIAFVLRSFWVFSQHTNYLTQKGLLQIWGGKSNFNLSKKILLNRYWLLTEVFTCNNIRKGTLLYWVTFIYWVCCSPNQSSCQLYNMSSFQLLFEVLGIATLPGSQLGGRGCRCWGGGRGEGTQTKTQYSFKNKVSNHDAYHNKGSHLTLSIGHSFPALCNSWKGQTTSIF